MAQRKKVFYILPDLSVGGAEKLVINLAEFIDKEKFEIKIVSLFRKNNNIYSGLVDEKKLPITYMNKKLGIDLNLMIRMTKLIIKEKPDIIHTHTHVVFNTLPGVILAGTKVRLHTVHNIAQKELNKFLIKIMRLAYKFFKFTPVAISETVKESIHEVYHIPLDKIPCIYNGIDTLQYKCKFIKHEDNINIIHVGRFSIQKNHKLLINAFYEALKINSNMKLHLVGDGQLLQDIIDFVEKIGIREYVVFEGLTAKVEDILNKSDIFILTSDWEGLPLSVLEAMACGLPIVSTKAGGVVDILNEGENCILTEIGDQKALTQAILKLAAHRELREQFSKKSIEYSKKYDVRKMADNYAGLYMKYLTLCFINKGYKE